MINLLILSTQSTPEGRVFGLDSQTLIQIGIQLLNGIILAVALTYILYKPVKGFLDKRKNRIQSEIDEAEKLKVQAVELIREYQLKIEEIEVEKQQIIESAQDKIEEERKVILQQARDEANELKDAAMFRISADRERMESEMRIKSIDIASELANRYLSDNLEQEAQRAYFERMLTQMEEASWSN
ncbi:hypothetical protein ACF3NG_03420 [Aerococcaceae bacterium WGS1372]